MVGMTRQAGVPETDARRMMICGGPSKGDIMPFAGSPRRVARILAASTLLAATLAAGPGAPAMAQVYAQALPCSTLQQMVQTQVRVVIHTAPFIYDTYTTMCGLHKRAVPAYIATRDVPRCFVGYTCLESSGRD